MMIMTMMKSFSHERQSLQVCMLIILLNSVDSYNVGMFFIVLILKNSNEILTLCRTNLKL